MDNVPVIVEAVSKKWYESRINWVNVFGIAAQIALFAGVVVPPELVANSAVALATAQSLVNIVLRTWFSPIPVENSLN